MSPLSILIVDDNADIRLSLKFLLSAYGYDVLTEAEDGRSALEVLRTTHVDVVVSDINMPGMDGFNLTRAIRSDAATGKIPVLLQSGIKGNRLEALSCGASKFVLKPDTDKEVMQFIQMQERRLMPPPAQQFISTPPPRP